MHRVGQRVPLAGLAIVVLVALACDDDSARARPHPVAPAGDCAGGDCPAASAAAADPCPQHATCRLDPHGRWVEQTYEVGRVVVSITRDLDAHGRELGRSRIQSGGIESHEEWTYGYDEQGRRITEALDQGADGRIDERRRFRYDPRGQRIYEGIDRNANGVWDEERLYQLDTDGRRVSYHTADSVCRYDSPCSWDDRCRPTCTLLVE